MVDYRYIVSDASSGSNLAELPLTLTGPFTRVLNGCGQMLATIPVEHPQATSANLEGDREVTVLRGDSPIWNGPITQLNPSRSSGVVQITVREASWYLSRRVLEISKSFNADQFYIFRWLVNYATLKRSNGTTVGGSSINAALPRFSLSPASGSSGTVKKIAYSAAARLVIGTLLDDLVADPTTGLEYRMDYTSASNRQTCQRVLTYASPSIGTTRTQILTEHLLYDFGRTSDRDRAANRVHTVANGYSYTLQNTGSVGAGDILIESVFDRSDTANHAQVQTYTAEARRRTQPPVRSYFASFVPGAALPYGWCDLGDTVTLKVSGPGLLAENASRRIVQFDVSPPSPSTPEVVGLTFNLPLDQLGT